MRSFSYEEEFAVIKPFERDILKKNDEPISMTVGIQNLLSILFEVNHINYSIHGTLKGSVTFGKVNLLITKMEIRLMKKETIYGGSNNNNTKLKIISSYELIDGGPYKNETIPFRFFLLPYNLTPTYIDIASFFSVRYYLNIVIKDQDNNKYFKQKEIFLYRLFLDSNSKNKYSNNNIDHLKNFITEPIDYGDYFSSFSEKDEKEETDTNKFKEPEPSDFYFRSNLKGFIEDNTKEEEKDDNNDINEIHLRNRSHSVFNYNKNINILNINNDENDNINNINIDNNNYFDDNLVDNRKKSSSTKKKKNENKKNQVMNIKEKNKYKTNDILINDNYYNVDNYIIYENNYNNIFDNKLKTNRIKNNLLEKKEPNNNINNNKNRDNIDEEKKLSKNANNNIDDFKLYFPDEPFSNSLIMNNYPSNYRDIRSGDDFRKNLMGERIKKDK